MTRLEQYVAKLDGVGASEMLLGPGRPPLYRSANGLVPLPDEPAISGEELDPLLEAWFGQERWAYLHSHRALSCVMGLGPYPRLRVRCTLANRGATLQLRLLDAPFELSELLLPMQLAQLADLSSGLVIITGPSGNGKTNALASLLQLVSERRRRHIVTLEHPIELLHHSRISSISQRELPTHCPSFASGVRSALSANADVIVLGKPDDAELCDIGARAAHSALVLAEVPGRGCVAVLERLVATSAARGDCANLSDAFAGIAALELLPKKNGGHVPACEIILRSPVVCAALREGKPGAVAKVPGPDYGPGSQTMEASKLELSRQGLIETRVS